MSNPQQQDVYPDDPRADVAPYVPHGFRSALEVGCGRGGFGRTLRAAAPEARLVGVEAVPEAADYTRRAGVFDEVLDGYFPDVLRDRDERFDLVVYNDVLEHIVDPWEVLRQTRDFIAPGGSVLASIPNVQFLPVVVDLVRARWEYAESGVLDRTHVRFFTRGSMLEMFEQTGYRVDVCAGNGNFFDLWTQRPAWGRRALKRTMGPLIRDMRYMGFIVVATPV
jgi:2-polyprenyl-3-methyl-5-hydroxy-6-metoxy-1,4-benzoquinol methylase